MKTLLAAAAIAAILVATIIMSVKAYMSVPIAIFSHSTGQCVKILHDGDIKAPCGKLPDRYHTEWTQ